jgi:hypothetical protein
MEINYVCSLGKMCHCAGILQRNGLKLCSYPFDWTFSECNTIIHCLEDDFKIFLDKSYYVDNITRNHGECKHTYYDVDSETCTFYHHNPIIKIDDYNYYIRCVNRFKKLLQCTLPKLFIRIIINKDNIDDNDKNKIIDFNNKFSNFTSNYTLLIIFNICNKNENYHEFTYNNNIHFLELHTLSFSKGLYFENENDNSYLDNIIKSTYSFNILPENANDINL